MGEIFLFGFVEQVCKKLATLALQEIKLVWGIKDECRRLLEASSAIEATLLDAEERQMHSNSEKDWLKKLRDVMEDINNVVDDMETEALRRRVENHFKDKVTHFLPQSDQLKMGRKIKNIRKRLDDIFKDAQQFNFRKIEYTRMEVSLRGRETYSYVRQSGVIGRDYDREKVVQNLLEGSGLSNDELFVVTILGIGGLGKTSLAQLVYNDERVKAAFETKTWVHVSTKFSLRKIIEDIVTPPNPNLPLEKLQQRLEQKLSGKRFLLVLDDVWIRELVEWKELKDLLMVGASGSRILVTAREKIVASIVGGERYVLEGLVENDSWSLFVKYAFEDGKELEHPELRDIGREIAMKSRGVPLAVKTLGGMLFSKTDEKEWRYVLNNDVWKLDQGEHGIMPILRLSFDQLPSYMKRCFAYCAVIPSFSGVLKLKEKLISLWMAQGLIPVSDTDEPSECIGGQIFNEFVARSFFQEVTEKDRFLQTVFQMHDLIHELARSVLGNEFSTVDLGTKSVGESVRHCSIYDFMINRPSFPDSLFKLKKLRTFIWICGNPTMEKPIPIAPIISNFRYLRVLDLNNTLFIELPSSIEKLRNLRYLEICGNSLLKRLPKSICKLYNLQTLRLASLHELVALPKGMRKLINLRRLTVTSKQNFFPESDIGALTSLQTLSIGFCEHLESLPNSLQSLMGIEDLNIVQCTKLCFSSSDMRGLVNLSRVSFVSVPQLVEIPKGLEEAAANTLRCLYIEDCVGLLTLPEWLGSFTKLERLSICNCPNLKVLPDSMHQLGSLKELHIENCPDLLRRCEEGVGEDWHKIAHVPKICLLLVS